MSKNMTRKGLAFGALVALGSSVIAGTPAFAIDPISLEPNEGTSYNTILGEGFTLKSIFTDAAQVGSEKVAFEVTDSASALDLNAVFLNGSDYDADSVTAGDQDPVLATSKFVVVGGNTMAPASNTVTLKAGGTATATVTVKAFLDFDGDATLDAGETVSSVATVKFVKASEVTAATVITGPLQDDVAAVATVKFNDINNEQLTPANVGAHFTKGDGTALSVTAADIVKFGATWSATDFFKFTTGTVAGLVKDTAVKVQPLYKATGLAATDTASIIGTAATATVVAKKAATIVAAASASNTAKVVSAGVADALLNSTFAVKATVKDAATTPLVVANQPVLAVITATGLQSTSPAKTLTVNGTSYSSSTALPGQGSVAKLALTTNAAGEAIVSLTTVGFAAGDTITVSFTTENLVASQVVVTQRAAVYTASVNSGAAVASAVDGSSVPVAVSVYDQFGGIPADKYDVTATLGSSDQANAGTAANATAAGSNSAIALVAGKATIGLVENGTGTGTNVYSLEVKERLTGNNYGATITTAVPFTVKVVSAAALVPGVVSSTTGVQNATSKVYEVAGPIALSLNDLKNADTRKVLETAPTVTNNQALAGSVTTVANATTAAVAIAGAQVTISGAGLQFYAGSVYAGNSITLATNASGAWAANVTSNKAGKQTITVTSGSATATITVVFAAAAEETGSAISLVAPTYILPGSTLSVSGVLSDKYGNAVDTDQAVAGTTPTFSVKYDGPGFLVGTPVLDATDAEGKFSFKVILGSNDTGTGTVTVKYDADGAGTVSAEITKTAIVTLGATPVPAATAAVSGSTKRFFVSVSGNSTAKNVVVKVAGKTFRTLKGSTAKKTYVVAAPKGSHKVSVYVGGKLIATKTISVK